MQALRNSYLGGVLIVLLLFVRLGKHCVINFFFSKNTKPSFFDAFTQFSQFMCNSVVNNCDRFEN